MNSISRQLSVLKISGAFSLWIVITIGQVACSGKTHVDYEALPTDFESIHEWNDIFSFYQEGYDISPHYTFYQYRVPSENSTIVHFSATDTLKYDRALHRAPVTSELITLWAVDRPGCAKKTRLAYIMELEQYSRAEMESVTKDHNAHSEQGQSHEKEYGRYATAEIQTYAPIALLVTNTARVSSELIEGRLNEFTASCAKGYVVRFERGKVYEIRVSNWSTPDSGYKGFGCEFAVYESGGQGSKERKADRQPVSKELLAELSPVSCSGESGQPAAPSTFVRRGAPRSGKFNRVYNYDVIETNRRKLMEQCAAHPERC